MDNITVDINNKIYEISIDRVPEITIDVGKAGARGPQGVLGSITVRNTTTLPAGSGATVVNVGNSSDVILDFGIPQGPIREPDPDSMLTTVYDVAGGAKQVAFNDSVAHLAGNETIAGIKTFSSPPVCSTSSMTDATNKKFCTDAEKTVIGNTSNTNSGDETNATIKTKLGTDLTNKLDYNGDGSSLTGLTQAQIAGLHTDDNVTFAKVTGAQGAFSSPNYPVINGERTTTSTNGIFSVLNFRNKTTEDMIDGLGCRLSFSIMDNANIDNPIASIGAVRSGADNSGTLVFQTYNSGVVADRWKISNPGNLLPAANNTYTIGETTTRPANIYSHGLDLTNTTNASQAGLITKNSTRFLHDFNYGNNGTVTTSGNNIFLGVNAGNLTMGSTATANYEGSFNIGIGVTAQSALVNGHNNVSVGSGSLNTVTNGYGNVAIGNDALNGITTGQNNIAMGRYAGEFLSNGTTKNTTANACVYIGYRTKASADGRTNETAIGYGAIGNGSNTVTIGNSSVTDTYLKGSVHATGTDIVGVKTSNLVNDMALMKATVSAFTPATIDTYYNVTGMATTNTGCFDLQSNFNSSTQQFVAATAGWYRGHATWQAASAETSNRGLWVATSSGVADNNLICTVYAGHVSIPFLFYLTAGQVIAVSGMHHTAVTGGRVEFCVEQISKE